MRITLEIPGDETALAKKQPAKEASTELIWADADHYRGAISPDGKYLSYVIDGVDLAVRDLATGKNRRLTSEGLEDKGWGGDSVFSPDGKKLAYAWWNQPGDRESYTVELRVVGLDGSAPRPLRHSSFDDKIQLLRPAGWSPDGKQILALFSTADDVQIAWVSLDDGPIRVLKTLAGSREFWLRRRIDAKLSPNGRFVVFTTFPSHDSTARDIAVLAVDGGLDGPLVEHSADDSVVGWSPDGNHVVFASDRTGSTGIWAIEVAEGKPKGAPNLLKAEIGRMSQQIDSLGMSQDGSLYFGTSSDSNAIYVAPFDPEKGDVSGEPSLASQQRWGSNFSPAWSPDGRYLAWVSSGPHFNWRTSDLEDRGPYRFFIRSMETGELRQLAPGVKRFHVNSLSWSPDGASLVGSRGGDGQLKIDLGTGRLSDAVGHVGRSPNWARDGKTIYDAVARRSGGWQISRLVLNGGRRLPQQAIATIFDLRDKNKDGKLTKEELEEASPTGRRATSLMRADANGDGVVTREELEKSTPVPGERTELFQASGGIRALALSPDEKQLAFWDVGASKLKVIPVAGGPPRELFEAEHISSIDWTPDGKHLVCTTDEFGVGSPQEWLRGPAWRIAVKGGEPHQLSMRMQAVDHIRFHPDGQKIAFVGKREQYKNDVWVLENFLPPLENNGASAGEKQAERKPKRTEPTVGQVRADLSLFNMFRGISSDGSYISHADLDTGNLAIHELATGDNRVLTKTDTKWRDFTVEHLFSRDGQKVAYNWYCNYRSIES